MSSESKPDRGSSHRDKTAARLRQRLDELTEDYRQLTGELGTETDADADEGTLEGGVSLTAESLEHIAREIRQIDEALDRLRHGEYGQCVDCDRPIEPARLKALPAAARCLACQASFERRRHSQRGQQECA